MKPKIKAKTATSRRKAKVVKTTKASRPSKVSKAAKEVMPQSNERIGIMGGTFNPVHVGHMNSALTVKQKLGLDKVLLVPSNQTPQREVVGPEATERLEMLRIATKPYADELEVCDIEIKRGGVSYTYETLTELGHIYKPENMFFILGADNFSQFVNWRNFETLIGLCNFVVTTRPGNDVSFDDQNLPQALLPFVKDRDKNFLLLTSGRTIQLVELEDVDTSSTDIRKRIRLGHDVRSFVPPAVLEYITTEGFYKRTSPLVENYRQFALYCGEKAQDKKALALKIYDMAKLNSYADYSVICSATSTKHAASIAEGILRSAKEDYGLTPISIEGIREGLWVLIDFGAVVVHVFDDVVRGQYNIEGLWRNCPQIQTELPAPQPVQRVEKQGAPLIMKRTEKRPSGQ